MVGVHAVGVASAGAYVGSVRGERDQRSQERGVLGDDHVARIDHHSRGQVESLLTALDDQHVVCGAGIPSRVSRSATWARSCGSPFEAVYCRRFGTLGDQQVRVHLGSSSTGNSAGSG